MSRGPQGESFAAKVRQAFADLALRQAQGPEGSKGVSVKDVAYRLDLPAGDRAVRPLRRTIADLKKHGRLRHVGEGLYLPVDSPAGSSAGSGAVKRGTPVVRPAIWRAVRACRSFSLDELARVSGAGRNYCRECVAALIRQGLVKNTAPKGQAGYYRLVTDPGPDLPGHDNAERLRRMRAARKEALEALEFAAKAIWVAKVHLAEEGEEDEHGQARTGTDGGTDGPGEG